MNKKGELLIISVFLVITVICIIFTAIVIMGFQINTQITGIKDSLFYLSQNAILAYNTNHLAYDKYSVDYDKLYSICKELIIKNHLNGKNKVNNISIKELKVITSKEECIYHTKGVYNLPILHVVLELEFNNILNEKHVVSIHEDVKMALMDY
ncbi:MAG: hypothetical protein IKV94_03715 [Clostridia bacterium]|nr:hypothetical protein [Clostridia bacterium]